jgi:Tol biopolymer transport system component
VARLVVTGGAVPLVEGVSRAGFSGAAHADVAAGLGGALVYLPAATGAEARTLVWVDRDGTETPLAAPPRPYLYPRLSPDGMRVAVVAADEEEDLWVWDLARETLRRLTFTPALERYAVWTPDGEGIIFDSQRDGAANLYRRAADGTGPVERLTESATNQRPQAISPDGRELVYREVVAGNRDLFRLTLDASGRAAPLVATEFNEWTADLSPDGRWLAYDSAASGQPEVYVRPYPEVEAGGLWQVSTAGGTRPRWGPDGRELFYLTAAGLMGVAIDTAADVALGRPALLVEGAYDGIVDSERPGRTYDVAPDGARFLMVKVGGSSVEDPYAGLTRIHVVQNWFEELTARVPGP